MNKAICEQNKYKHEQTLMLFLCSKLVLYPLGVQITLRHMIFTLHKRLGRWSTFIRNTTSSVLEVLQMLGMMFSTAELMELPLADLQKRFRIISPNSSFPLEQQKLKPQWQLTYHVPRALSPLSRFQGSSVVTLTHRLSCRYCHVMGMQAETFRRSCFLKPQDISEYEK